MLPQEGTKKHKNRFAILVLFVFQARRFNFAG